MISYYWLVPWHLGAPSHRRARWELGLSAPLTYSEIFPSGEDSRSESVSQSLPGWYFPAIIMRTPWESSSDSSGSPRIRKGELAVSFSSIPLWPLDTEIGDGAKEARECPSKGNRHSWASWPSDKGRPKKKEDER